MMAHRETLLAVMATGWADLEGAIAAARERFEVADEGGWRPRDAAAHIATWERMAARKIAGTPLPVGEDLATATPWNLNRFNDGMIERCRAWSAAEVLTEVAAAHEALVAAVSGADEASCAPGGTTWTAIDDDGAGHYDKHFAIPNAMAERWPEGAKTP